MAAGPDKPAAPEDPGKAPASGEPGKPLTPQEAAQSADPVQRLDGLRAWVAQLDRKLGTRFYALAAAVVLALAAGIVSLVIVLGLADDSATKTQVEELKKDITGVERTASSAADDEIAALDDRLAELESQVRGLRSDEASSDREISVLQDDIDELRDDVSQLESTPGGNASGGSGQSSP